MTTPEHAMLAVSLTAAVRLHERFGAAVLFTAAAAAVAPDWDGLAGIVDLRHFDHGHRVWGHGLLPAVLAGGLIAAADWATGASRRAAAALRTLDGTRPFLIGRPTCATSACVGIAAAVSHLPADIVVSGADGIEDWPVSVLWPLPGPQVVYPMLRWGDPGPTAVFVLAAFAAASGRLSATAAARWGLTPLVIYLAIGRVRILAGG